MTLAQVHGVVLWGVTGVVVTVEVEVSDGLPGVGVVGLPDTSVTEARWRARSAVASAGATWPSRRVTISITPAEVPKNGAGLDLPIAIGVLQAAGQLAGIDLQGTAFIGELGLDGRLHPTRGALAGVLAARRAGLTRVVASAESADELGGPAGITVVAAVDLAHVLAVLRGEDTGQSRQLSGQPCDGLHVERDLADVRGHEQARFALEVAAAGGHHAVLVGPPGVGKTLLCEVVPSLLPDLTDDEALEVAAIHGVAGRDRCRHQHRRPPFQAPHHSASSAALLGAAAGRRVVPGAVTLAHRGVLFLDEAPEFARPSLEGLRQPLESGKIAVHRAGWSGVLPASCQLLLAANPCPCGLRSGRAEECSCTAQAVRRYASRLSAALLDRIDLRLALMRPTTAELASPHAGEASAVVRARVTDARERARRRFAGHRWSSNALAPAAELRRHWPLGGEAADLLAAAEQRSANLRGPDRVLRLAWTMADLAGRRLPDREDVARALSLRGMHLPWAA